MVARGTTVGTETMSHDPQPVSIALYQEIYVVVAKV